MANLLLRGRNPAQIVSIFVARLTKACRRIWLHLRRRTLRRSEEAWLECSGAFRWLLTESEAQVILSRYPDEQAQIFEEAQLAISGWAEVPGFGRREIRLRSVAQDSEADAYAHRLLCRLDFLRPLCRAALIADDPSDYHQAVQRLLQDWSQARKRQQERNTVDDSIRILNLLEVISILKEYLNKDTIKYGLDAVIDATWNIEINRTRTGNHLIYEGLALMAAGFSLQDHPRAELWFRLGKRILQKQIIRQVLPDGFNAELSANYHLITGTNFLKGWILSSKAGCEMNADYRQRLAQMASVASHLHALDGGFLALGDSDRMAGDSREEREARAFAVLGTRIRRGGSGARRKEELAKAHAAFELDWLLADREFYAGKEIQGTESDNLILSGGYHICGNSGGRLVVFDTGPFGLPGASHHGHADSLSFEAHINGIRFLADPGGFSYVDQQARAFARSTAAHNTLRVDGRNSSEVTGSFSFGKGAQARCLKATQIAGGYLLVGEHDGYSPIVHRRALFWLLREPLRLIILDQILGTGEHSIEAFFHADFGWQAHFEDESCLLWAKEKYSMVQLIWCSADWQMNVIEGQTEPEWQGWVSPAFGKYFAAPALAIACRGQLPLELVSVFCEETDERTNVSLDGANRTIQMGEKILTWNWTEDFPSLNVN